ncbi:MAG: O-antigen ligase family protein [Terriglobales bacterium]
MPGAPTPARYQSRDQPLEALLAGLLIFTSVLDLWVAPFPIGRFHLRASELLVLPGALVLLHRLGRLGRRAFWPPFAVPALLLPGFYLGWSLINSAEPTAALGHSALLVLDVLQYWLVAVLAGTSWAQFRRCLGWVAVAVIPMCLWMAISYRLNLNSHFEDIALGDVMAGSAAMRLNGGVLAATAGAWAAVLCCGGLGLGRVANLLAVLGICGGVLAAIVGISRAAIVALVLGMALLGYVLARKGHLRSLLVLALVSVLVAAFTLAMLQRLFPTTGLSASVSGRVALLLDPSGYNTGTVRARVQSWTMMLDDVARDPLWGRGGDSYHMYFPVGVADSENFTIEILHGTGIWGFGALLWLVGGVLIGAYRRAISDGLSMRQRRMVAAALAAMVALFVASQTNPIGWSAVFWVALGLAAAATRLPQPRTALAPSFARLRAR